MNLINFIKQLLWTDSVIQTVISSGQRETNKQIYTILSGKDMNKMQNYLNRVAREGLSEKGNFFLPSLGRETTGRFWAVDKNNLIDHI